METGITVVHVIVCVCLLLGGLWQAGKGGGMGLSFGGSSSGTVFGGSGAGNFLSRLTGFVAATFMITSLTLAYMASRGSTDPLEAFSKEARKKAAAEAALKQQFTPPEGTQAPAPGLDSAATPEAVPTPTPGPASATPESTTPAPATPAP